MTKAQKIKQRLLEQCHNALEYRYEVICKLLGDIKQAMQSETKSSAGDKHETGRAMLQLEREKAGRQLAEIEHQKQVLARVQINSLTNIIGLGSLIITPQANYFIAISAGKIEYNGSVYYAISAASPMAKLLLGKEKGDTLQFQNKKITITEVF
jgi:hypothetical protein